MFVLRENIGPCVCRPPIAPSPNRSPRPCCNVSSRVFLRQKHTYICRHVRSVSGSDGYLHPRLHKSLEQQQGGAMGCRFPLPVPLTPDRWTGLLCSPALDRTSNYASTPHQTSHPHALLSVWCGSEPVRGNKATPLACNLSVDWAWVSSPLPCHCARLHCGSGSRTSGLSKNLEGR